MSIDPIKVGARHPSWPPYLRAGMIVHMNWPDPHEPLGRIVGAVSAGSHREGQPVYLPLDVGEPVVGESYDFKVTLPMFLLPCPPEKRSLGERLMSAALGETRNTTGDPR